MNAAPISRIQSYIFEGIDAKPVTVEVQISSGLPAFLIVGMADKAVGEARERVRAALSSMGLSLPPKRILVNLAPADVPKAGSHLDLPIALGLLTAMGAVSAEDCINFAAIGELSLDGRILPVTGVLSAAIGASDQNLGLICPRSQGPEARWGHEDLEILAPETLQSLLEHFKGDQVLADIPQPKAAERVPCPDLKDVKGLPIARRVLEIAASGGHSLLMSGPPGSGKTMLAQRLSGLLPDLARDKILETSRIHAMAGMLEAGSLVVQPPFRNPHHNASAPALTGGGTKIRPGEISLAHNGVLFLDELPELNRAALESLRQPLEDGKVTIARTASHVTFPASFQFIAAMNPCKCGYMGDSARECRKAPKCGEDYLSKLSGPLLDRIDLSLAVYPIEPKELAGLSQGESSAEIRPRVQACRELQYARQGVLNAELNPNDIVLTDETRLFFENACAKLKLSTRATVRLLRVARTIADMERAENIERKHLAEAINYRLVSYR